MIKAIHMKDCATYRDNTSSFNDLQKVNFIYGANGSGKSTVSNYLKNQNDPKYASCSIEWSGDPIEVEVYNREFRQEHFQDNIDGVFTLGKATKEQIAEVEQMKEERKNIETRISGLSKTLQEKRKEAKSAETLFKEALWNGILKKNEEKLGNAFTGFRGSKNAFYEEFCRRVSSKHTYKGSYEELLSKAKTLFSKKPERIERFSIDILKSRERVEIIKQDSVWDTVIIGNNDVPIADLIKKLNNNDWVRKGKSYIYKSSICPFCQKETIDDSFRKQLEDFFDTTYERQVTLVDDYKKNYECEVVFILDMFRSIAIDSRVAQIKFPLERYNMLIQKIQDTGKQNVEEIRKKQNEPSRKIELISIDGLISEILGIIKDANNAIEGHNTMVANLDIEKESFISDVWAYCITDQKALIDSYNTEKDARDKAIKGITSSIDKTVERKNSLAREIIEKEKNITSVQPTVNEINRSLKAYGFEGFRIVPSPTKDNSYQIQRQNGELATHTLSEGEETFISFLYFMQYVKGANDLSKVSARKVMVLDDPICSLDSTVLYVVSAMVKELAKSIKDGLSDVEQLIVLTHNVFFHKEASFVNGRINEENTVNYWIISKDNNISRVRAYGKKNPISTSYELLWRELRENTSSSLVTTQNIMRRIIENYFNMLGKDKDDKLINSFATTEEKVICKALLYWINDGSHSINDDIFIDSYSDSIEKYKSVFRQIFINTGNIAHYNMMMQIEQSE